MPGDKRWATYKIHRSALTESDHYKAQIKFIVGMVPINLVNEIKEVGFDYDMTAKDIAEGVVGEHTTHYGRKRLKLIYKTLKGLLFKEHRCPPFHLFALLSLISVNLSLNTWAGGSETELTQEAIPVNPESDAQCTLHEIHNLEGFINVLQQESKKEQPSPSKRIYALFNSSIKTALDDAPDKSTYSPELKHRVVVTLNRILRRTNLYEPAPWKNSSISQGLRNAYDQTFSALGPVDKARLNRLLLHKTFPLFVQKPTNPTFPDRPRRLHLFGDRFLGSENLQKGFTLPTDAVWQPSLFVFGTFRSTIQTFDGGTDDSTSFTEWVNRLDLQFNLALTPTERILIGFRPLDEAPDFTGYQFNDITQRKEGFEEFFDESLESLFFEGDLGELFPFFDPGESRGLDLGFAIGRQPVTFQNGFMIDDSIDAIGLTKNNLFFPKSSNLRINTLYGWNDINRTGSMEDNKAEVFGLFSSTDFQKTSMDLDIAYVDSDRQESSNPDDRFGGDSLHLGLGFIQRVGLYNTSLRINTSITDEPSSSVDEGTLFFADVSYTPAYSENLVYITLFYALDHYSALARRATAQGPLGPAGILFAGSGIGRIGAPLDNTAQDVAGSAIGYQMFFNHTRSQLIAELGGRFDTTETTSAFGDAIGVGLQFQHALGQHYIFRIDGALASVETGNTRYSAGTGLTIQF
ncbi:MAG: hypothetical protein GKR87_02125 [Kiritimatiellae bacterium]|nr:hypothetical protein [Kiritimatiellia bacterium]